jgi:hypothetical protein
MMGSRWAGHVAQMEKTCTQVLYPVEDMEEAEG